MIDLRLGHTEQVIEILSEKKVKTRHEGVATIYKFANSLDHKFVHTPEEDSILHICVHNHSKTNPSYVTFRLDTGHFAGDKQTLLQKSDLEGLEKQVAGLEYLSTDITLKITEEESIHAHRVRTNGLFYTYVYSGLTVLSVLCLVLIQNWLIKRDLQKKKII